MKADLTVAQELDKQELDKQELDKQVDTQNTDSGGEVPVENEQHSTEGSPSEPEKNDEGSILAETGFESVEALKNAVSANKELSDKLGGRDLSDVLEKADKFAEAEKERAREEEEARRNSEEPSETIARLERQLDEVKGNKKQAESERIRALEAEKAVAQYDQAISSAVDASKNLSGTAKEFLKEVLNSSNPSVNVDINNAADVKKMTSEMVKKMEQFGDSMIQDYIDGKSKVPNLGPSAPAAPKDDGGYKTIDDATKGILKRLGARK